MSNETTEPRIFITVSRMVNGCQVRSDKEISLLLWERRRPGANMIACEIDAMLQDVRNVWVPRNV